MDKFKGAAIRFVKGKYAGMNGWVDKEGPKDVAGPYRRVIVNKPVPDEEDEDKLSFVELRTKVMETSIRNRHPTEPSTYEEAMFMQNPDIEEAMVAFAAMLAQCALFSNHEILRVFAQELDRAQIFHQKLGHKARFRHVEFKEVEVDDDEDDQRGQM